jgi:adenylate cyclase
MIERDRKIATILAADVVGYSRLMQRDELGTLHRLAERRGVFDTAVTDYGGRVFGSVGDSLMAEFPSAVNAVRCAQRVQELLSTLNDALSAERRMDLRIGINLGDVIERDNALFGDGVNLAARLQSLAQPGGVLLSAAVYEQVKGKIAPIQKLGRRRVKSFDEPVEIYAVQCDSSPAQPSWGRRSLTIATAGAIAAIGVVAGIAWWLWSEGSGAGARDARPVVAVAEIQNLTGRVEVDWLSPGLASLVRDRLAQSKFLVTVSEGRWRTITQSTSDTAAIQVRAREAGIDFLVSGELLASPTGLILTNRISNLRDGSELLAQTFENLSETEVINAAFRLAILTKQALKVPPTEQIDSYAADFAVQHISAYQAYVNGLRFHRQWDFRAAEQSMQTALKLAPEFHMARYRLAMIKNATGSTRAARELMAAIPGDALVGTRERYYIEAARAFFAQDFTKAAAAYVELLKLFPNEIEAHQRLAEVYFHDRRDDDAIRELRFLGQLEPGNEEVWNQLTAYLTLSGRLDEAEQANAEHRKLMPEAAHPLALAADIHAQRGEYAKGLSLYDEALKRQCKFPPALVGRARVLAIQGRIAEAVLSYRELLADENVEMEERLTGAFDLAALLRARGEYAESSKVLEEMTVQLFEEEIRVALALALRSRNALDLGNLEDAARLAAQAVSAAPAGAKPTRYLYARGLVELARKDHEAVALTIAAIRKLDEPGDERKEEKAAAHLEGLLATATDQVSAAQHAFEKAVSLPGSRYAIYEIELARVFDRLGNEQAADRLLAAAVNSRDIGDARIDLEPDRARALRTRIEVLGDDRPAVARLEAQLRQRWGSVASDSSLREASRCKQAG